MKISTRGQYGTRLLLDLALSQEQEPVLLRDIARRQNIPLAYLKHLVPPLVSAGILRSARGAGGGLLLARPPEQIKLNEVVSLLEGPIAPVDCLSDPAVCRRSGFCAPQDMWRKLQTAMIDALESFSLRELMENQKEKDARPAGAMYNI